MKSTTARLRAILDAVTDGYYLLDRDWRFTEVNSAAARHFGRAPLELIGANIWHETGLGPGTPLYDKFQESVAGGVPVRFEAESRLHPGEWYELSLLPHDGGLDVFFHRITDRKLAQTAATRAAEQRGLALEIANLGTWEYDEAADAIRLDARSAQVLGLSPDAEHTLAEFLAVVDPDDRDIVRADVAKALDPRGTAEYVTEHRIQHPDGTIRWVVARGRALSSQWRADSRRRLFFGTLMEVTERKRVEEEREQLLAEFNATVACMTDAVVIHRMDGSVAFMNRSAEKLLDYPDDLQRLSVEEQIRRPPIRPEGRAFEKTETLTARALRGETVEPQVVSFRRRNGEERWLSIDAAAMVTPKGQRLGAVTVLTDITDRKQAENALRTSEANVRNQAVELQAVLDALPAAVFITHDPEARQMVGNRFAEQLLRLPPGSNLSKSAPSDERPTTFRAMIGGVEISAEALPVQLAMRTGEEVRDYEFDMVYEDGKVTSLLGNAAPLLDEQQRVRGAVGAFVDVTRLKQVEDALNRANAGLADADQRKDEFIAILSHELRNPLAPIRYALPVLQRERLTQPAARAVQVIDRQVDHLTRLVDDLLDVSRITRGKIELRKEHVTLSSVVSAAVEAASPGVSAARHTLELAVSDEPVWLYADGARIAQVITNLLNNSAKYTPRGGRLTLEARVEGRDAVVRVVDNGMGIPPQEIPSVFEMFRQVNRPDKSQGGLGIGLALVKRLVEKHGGTVEARSGGPGHGSEFIVRLPVASEARIEEQPEGSRPSAPSKRRLKVLIVDDNPDLVEMLAILVETAGHEVRKALDGRSAVSAAFAYRPDVVLLDLGLPVMTGLEVARELRRKPEMERVRLVALTGWGQPEDRRQTEEAGFDDHLTKPADAQRLEQLLHRIAMESGRRSLRTSDNPM